MQVSAPWQGFSKHIIRTPNTQSGIYEHWRISDDKRTSVSDRLDWKHSRNSQIGFMALRRRRCTLELWMSFHPSNILKHLCVSVNWTFYLCQKKKFIITNYYFLEMKENRFLRLWLGLHLISCRSGGKKVVDTPCIDILHWESLESPRAVHLWYGHSQQNKKHLHLFVQKRFFHKYFCDNVWGCIFKKGKKKTFFHCLPYILWVGLVRSPCLDIFETDCFPAWTFSPLPHGNWSGPAAQCQRPTSTLPSLSLSAHSQSGGAAAAW